MHVLKRAFYLIETHFSLYLIDFVYTIIYTIVEVIRMETAKIFMNGQSQAVRLPKEFRFSDDEIYIKKVGSVTMLFPKDEVWQTHLDGLQGFSDDFMEDGRPDQEALPERETL